MTEYNLVLIRIYIYLYQAIIAVNYHYYCELVQLLLGYNCII